MAKKPEYVIDANKIPFRRLNRKQQLDKIYNYVRASNDDLDKIMQWIMDDIDGDCRIHPMAKDETLKKYDLGFTSKAAYIIGYLEELKQKK